MATRQEKIESLHAEAEEYERLQGCTAKVARQAIATWYRVADWETLVSLPTDDPQRPARPPAKESPYQYRTTHPQDRLMNNDDQREALANMQRRATTGFPEIDRHMMPIEKMPMRSPERDEVIDKAFAKIGSPRITVAEVAPVTEVRIRLNQNMTRLMEELEVALDMDAEHVLRQALRLYQSAYARQQQGDRMQFVNDATGETETIFIAF